MGNTFISNGIKFLELKIIYNSIRLLRYEAAEFGTVNIFLAHHE